MREASAEIESVLEYCKEILNAESEEEILRIEDEIAQGMRMNGTSEEVIQDYLFGLDQLVLSIESGEFVITEDGMLLRNDNEVDYSDEETDYIVDDVLEQKEIEAIEVVEERVPDANINRKSSAFETSAFNTITLAIAVSIALRKIFFKNKNNRKL